MLETTNSESITENPSAEHIQTDATMSPFWAGLAFSSLGLLTGLLTGMAASSVVSTVLGSIFGLLGGSFVGLMQKLSLKQQELAAKCIAALSLSCIVGVVLGILICEHHLLSSGVQIPTKFGETKYLKALKQSEIDRIDNNRRQNDINLEEAYHQLKRYATDNAQ